MINVLGELPPDQWRRLNALLGLALDVEPEAREAWFQALPPADAALLPMLRGLLEEAGSQVPAGGGELAPPRLEGLGAARPERTELPGEQIGPYRLVRELGRGGMAVVWLAERVDGKIDRRVALKIPNAEWTDRGLGERIRRECAVLASLNHPNIAQLYDAGWSDTGLPYLAMEVVDGMPIDRYCTDRSLDVRARARLFIDVLRAVAYAHARLVVHRDLKPANVLVSGDGRVKLLDFGVAKVLSEDASPATDSDLTRSSGHPVTLGYAAPEQVLGQPVTTATDIYALGVMLFELLCGKRPFRTQTGLRSAAEEAMTRGDAPAPSSLAAQPATSRAVRGDLDAIVRKALRKDPEQRFETSSAFADDLERFLSGRPVQARRGNAWYRVRRFVGRNRVVVGASFAVAVALVGGLGAALWQARRAAAEAQETAAIANFVLSVIQQSDPQASQQTRSTDLALLRTMQERIEHELPNRPRLRFSLRLAVATAYRNRGEPKEAAALLRAALQDAQAAGPVPELELLRAKVLLGEVSEDDKERAEMLERTIPVLRAMGPPGAELLVDALLARTPTNRIKDPGADADLREALSVAIAQFGPGNERTLKAAYSLAYRLGPGVLERSQEALSVLEEPYRAAVAGGRIAPGNPDFLHAQSLYGQILCVTGRGAEGIPLLEQSLRVAVERHFDGKELRSALLYLARGQRNAGELEASIATFVSIYRLLASQEAYGGRLRYYYGGDVDYVLLRARRPLEAEPFIDEARAYRASLTDANGATAGEVEFQIAFKRLGTQLRLGEYAAARTLGEAMLQHYRRDKSPYFEYVTNIFLGEVYLATAQPQKAQATAQAALDYALREGAIGSDQTLHFGTLARAILAQGNAAQALAVTDKAQDVPDPSDRANPDLADFRLTRGRALLALGRARDALVPLERASEFWNAFAPASIDRQRAAYWYAQALAVTGDTAGALRLHAPAQRPPDYPPADSARLLAERSRPATARIEAVLRKYPLRPEVAALLAKTP